MVKKLSKRERGVALLAVMLGVALMTLIVVDFSTTAALGYMSAANQANELRAYYLARSAVAVGLGLLAEDSRIDSVTQPPFDSLNDIWAVPFPPVNVEGGTASISIVDDARKLNINQIVNPSNGEINTDFAGELERLFTILGVSPQIIPAIADWIDADSVTPATSGAELDFYMRLRPPYAPRNGPMPTIGDLKMIRGIDDATFNRIRPFLTVMPEMQVNVNTAPPEVLAAVSPKLFANPDAVKAIVTARMIRPFGNMTDVGNIPAVGQYISDLSKVLTTRSNYFTISGMGTYAGARMLVHSTFRRQPNGTGLLAVWQED
jgi:general secretion pathway protein K